MARVWDNLIGLLGFYPSGDVGPYTCYTTKKGKVVFFVTTLPTGVPSLLQRQNRSRFHAVAWLWANEPSATRQLWRDAARLAGLSITGYNLFTYFVTSKDVAAINTVERISGITLI